MQRKVIQLARKTAVVSLPSKWVKKNNIQKGDELEVEEDNKRLIISTKKALTLDKQNINANTGYDPLTIAYLYQAGVDEINLKYEHPEIYTQIKEKLPDLMGYEIVDQSENHVDIKNLSEVLEEQFETLLRRIFHIIEDLGKSSLEAIERKDFQRLKLLLPIENSVDKFTDFCKRVLNKKSYKDNKSQFYYVIVRDLEKIGDLYEDIVKTAIEEKTTLNQELIKLFQTTNKLFSAFHKLFYTNDEKIIEEFKKLKYESKQKGITLLKQKENVLIAHSLVILSKMIADLYGPFYITKI